MVIRLLPQGVVLFLYSGPVCNVPRPWPNLVIQNSDCSMCLVLKCCQTRLIDHDKMVSPCCKSLIETHNKDLVVLSSDSNTISYVFYIKYIFNNMLLNLTSETMISAHLIKVFQKYFSIVGTLFHAPAPTETKAVRYIHSERRGGIATAPRWDNVFVKTTACAVYASQCLINCCIVDASPGAHCLTFLGCLVMGARVGCRNLERGLKVDNGEGACTELGGGLDFPRPCRSFCQM